jgi:hypothetical protein
LSRVCSVTMACRQAIPELRKPLKRFNPQAVSAESDSC